MENPYFERPVTGIKAAICTKCNAVKPLAEFKRRLSRAQSQARGYAAVHALEIESSMCKACQPKAKPLKEQTQRALKIMAGSGDARPYIVNEILAERKANKVKSGRIASVKRWRKVHEAQWGSVIAGARAELLAVHQQHKYAKKQMGKPNQTGGQPVHEFLEAYKALLSQTKARIGLAAEQTQGGPSKHKNGTDWLSYIDNDTKDNALDLWQAIPPEMRARLRQPEITKKRTD
jgi:hypothetical protein